LWLEAERDVSRNGEKVRAGVDGEGTDHRSQITDHRANQTIVTA
jgi:hypothetical protein